MHDENKSEVLSIKKANDKYIVVNVLKEPHYINHEEYFDASTVCGLCLLLKIIFRHNFNTTEFSEKSMKNLRAKIIYLMCK